MIVNRKTVDPSDSSSAAVYQLETAMGAAIDVFEGAAAIEVGRERFAPVKTTNDLLVVRSDAYELTDDADMRLVRDEPPVVDLDSDHYKLISDFDAHFPAGAPSLKDCDRLRVDGDVVFGGGVVVRGSVAIEGDQEIPDGAVLEG
jgi:UTP--glucose-1-phosphate uridylyltransferase